MDFEEVRDGLAKVFEAMMAAAPVDEMVLGLTEENDPDEQARSARALAGRLLSEALANGISHWNGMPEIIPLSGGRDTQFVFRLRTNMSFVVKVHNDRKLLDQIIWLKSKLPEVEGATPWGALVPRVLAHRLDASPYAYIMEDLRQEDGYRELAWWIFESDLLPQARYAQSRDILDAALDQLQSVYISTRSLNSRPSLESDTYLHRIEASLTEAVEKFPGFTLPLEVGNKSYNTWNAYLDTIRMHSAEINEDWPMFVTSVHGDPHPGNIIVRLGGKTAQEMRPEIRFIDPKGWHLGDYVFDLAKIAHSLELCGPLDHWDLAGQCRYHLENDVLYIDQFPEIPGWLSQLACQVGNRAESMAELLGDANASQRFALAMAANLLGLVGRRTNNGETTTAVALYVNGIGWLEKFCDKLK